MRGDCKPKNGLQRGVLTLAVLVFANSYAQSNMTEDFSNKALVGATVSATNLSAGGSALGLAGSATPGRKMWATSRAS